MRVVPQVARRDRDEGDFPVVGNRRADFRQECVRGARRVVEMVATAHRREDRLTIGALGIRVRFAVDVHGELIGSALRVAVQLDGFQKHAGGEPAMTIAAAAPNAVAGNVDRVGQLMFGFAKNFSQCFLWIEFSCRGRRTPRALC